jgi:hypothetical protein
LALVGQLEMAALVISAPQALSEAAVGPVVLVGLLQEMVVGMAVRPMPEATVVAAVRGGIAALAALAATGHQAVVVVAAAVAAVGGLRSVIQGHPLIYIRLYRVKVAAGVQKY